MHAHTHVLGGLALAGLAVSLGAPHPITLTWASAVGSLLPDWDHPQSTVGRWIPWPAATRSRGPFVSPQVGRAWFSGPIWHRHQAHSLVGVAIVSLLATAMALAVAAWIATVIPWVSALFRTRGLSAVWLWIGLFLGGLSHLALDGFNDTPQWWIWPMSTKSFRWPVHAMVSRIDPWASLGLTVIDLLWAWHLGLPWLHGALAVR